jgi:two-component system sensor histidine kinase KdpD
MNSTALEKTNHAAESERQGRMLLSLISHEIRTPLTAIQSAASNLAECGQPELSEFQEAMVAEIQEASNRLNRFVGKVLQITRLESGCFKPKFGWYDVSELVWLAEAETRKELAQHNLSIDIPPGLPLVKMDFELMLHSLANLLSNAAFHTPPGTAVRLSVKIEDGAVLFIVADRGPGIPPESIPRLFEKFYRAPSSRVGGTGLGLFLVKGVVEAHGGRVRAENRPLGGASFTIRLPAPAACHHVISFPPRNRTSFGVAKSLA